MQRNGKVSLTSNRLGVSAVETHGTKEFRFRRIVLHVSDFFGVIARTFIRLRIRTHVHLYMIEDDYGSVAT